MIMTSEASPHWTAGWETLYCCACPYLSVCGDVSIYLLYIHVLESTRKILWTGLKRDIVILEISRWSSMVLTMAASKTKEGRLKRDIVILEISRWSSMVLTMAASKTKEGSLDAHTTCMFDSCQGKGAGVIF